MVKLIAIQNSDNAVVSKDFGYKMKDLMEVLKAAKKALLSHPDCSKEQEDGEYSFMAPNLDSHDKIVEEYEQSDDDYGYDQSRHDGFIGEDDDEMTGDEYMNFINGEDDDDGFYTDDDEEDNDDTIEVTPKEWAEMQKRELVLSIKIENYKRYGCDLILDDVGKVSVEAIHVDLRTWNSFINILGEYDIISSEEKKELLI